MMTFELLQFVFNLGITLIVALLYMRIRDVDERPNRVKEIWKSIFDEVDQMRKQIEKECMISIEMEKAINLLRDRLTALEEKDAK